jgi:hypothetical protein
MIVILGVMMAFAYAGIVSMIYQLFVWITKKIDKTK